MPSTSLERRARVVTEIDSVEIEFLLWSSIRVKVVLPAGRGKENQHQAAPAGRLLFAE